MTNPAPALGQGVGTLIHGVPVKVEATPTPAAEPLAKPSPKAVTVIREVLRAPESYLYFAADLVLLTLAVLVTLLRARPFGFLEAAVVCALVAGGMVFAAWPFWTWEPPVEAVCAPGQAPKWALSYGPDEQLFVVHLHNPQFIGRVVRRMGKTVIQPVATIAWCQIPRRVGDRLLAEALGYVRSQKR